MPSLEKLDYWSLLSLPLSTADIRRLEITIGLVRTLIQPYLIRFFGAPSLVFSFISHEMIARRNQKQRLRFVFCLVFVFVFVFLFGRGGGGKQGVLR